MRGQMQQLAGVILIAIIVIAAAVAIMPAIIQSLNALRGVACADVEEQLAHCQTEKDNLQTELISCQTQLSSLEYTLRSCRNDLEGCQGQLEARINELSSCINNTSRLEEELGEKDAEINRILAELRECRSIPCSIAINPPEVYYVIGGIVIIVLLLIIPVRLPKLKMPKRKRRGRVIRGVYEGPVGEERVKSVSKQHTFKRVTRNSKLIYRTLDTLAEQVYQDVLEMGVRFQTVTVAVKYGDLKSHTRQKTLKKPSNERKVIKKAARELFGPYLMSKKKIKLVRVKVSRFKG